MSFDILKNNNVKRLVFFALLAMTLVWMAVIFGFSSNNAEDSSRQSSGVTEFLAGILVPGFDELARDVQEEIIAHYDGHVRKLAHFVSYAILGALCCGTAVMFPFARIKSFWLPVLLSAAVSIVFAVSDEYHQTFVDGRAGQLKDVLIDSAGALCGIAATVLIVWIIGKRLDKS